MLGLFGVALSKRLAGKRGRYAKTAPDGESLKKLVDSRLLTGFWDRLREVPAAGPRAPRDERGADLALRRALRRLRWG